LQKFDEIITNSSLDISIANEEFSTLLKKARIVIGINTMALFEAALSGLTTISYQPGMKKENDPLMSNHLNLSMAAYSFKDLEKMLKTALKFSGKRNKNLETVRKKYINAGATQNVINLIEKFVD